MTDGDAVILPLISWSDAGPPTAVRDPSGRSIGYLRLSITKACHLRCVYCRPEFDRNVKRDELTAAEIEALVTHLAHRHGVRKVRLTGGDPTARGDLVEIIARVARVPGVRDVAMTTHGLTLAKHAAEYAQAGLRRVNVSLDSLRAETFAGMTSVDGVERVLEGIEAAAEHLPGGVKINTVVVRGRNDDQLHELLGFGADFGVPVRFIELMPMGPLAGVWAERFVPEAKMREALAPHVEEWTPLEQGSDAARRYAVRLRDGRRAEVGFITPMSCNFCANCDRLRVASDGAVFPCLMDAPAGNLLHALRPVFDPDAIDRTLAAAYGRKAPEHPHDGVATMTHIGG